MNSNKDHQNMKLLNIASILVLSASSLALGTGCMSEVDDPANVDDQAELSTTAADQDSADEESTGETQEAWLGLGYGSYGYGGLGLGGYGGLQGGCGLYGGYGG